MKVYKCSVNEFYFDENSRLFTTANSVIDSSFFKTNRAITLLKILKASCT